MRCVIIKNKREEGGMCHNKVNYLNKTIVFKFVAKNFHRISKDEILHETNSYFT